MPTGVRIELDIGESFEGERRDCEGSAGAPGGQHVVAKFERLAEPFTDRPLREAIASAAREPGRTRVAELIALLARVRREA